MPTITITEGETASFGGQPWPTQNLDTYFSTALTSGTAQLADFVVHSNGFYFRVNDYIGDPTDGVLAPVIWHFDTVDDELAEGTESAEVNIYYETRATPDSPLVTGTFGPITIVILDNDEAVVEEEPPIEEEPPVEDEPPSDNDDSPINDDPIQLPADLFFDTQSNEYGTVTDNEIAIQFLTRKLTAVTANINNDGFYIDALQDEYQDLAREILDAIDQISEPADTDPSFTYAPTEQRANFIMGVLDAAKKISIARETNDESPSKIAGLYLDAAMSTLFTSTKGNKFTKPIGEAIQEGTQKAYITVTEIWGPSSRQERIMEEIEEYSRRVGESREKQARLEDALEVLHAAEGQPQSTIADIPTVKQITTTYNGETITSVGNYFFRDLSEDTSKTAVTIRDNELLYGSSTADEFRTESTNGSFAVDGEGGFDTLSIDQRSSVFSIEIGGNTFQLSSSASDVVGRNIERIAFNQNTLDQETLALDFDGVAGQTYRLYQAAFDRTPDKPGLGFWIENFDVGNVTLSSMAQHFMTSVEFSDSYGAIETLPDESYLNLLYENVLGRSADQAGFDFWSEQQEQGVSREDMLVYFSESVENVGLTSSIVTDGIWF